MSSIASTLICSALVACVGADPGSRVGVVHAEGSNAPISVAHVAQKERAHTMSAAHRRLEKAFHADPHKTIHAVKKKGDATTMDMLKSLLHNKSPEELAKLRAAVKERKDKHMHFHHKEEFQSPEQILEDLKKKEEKLIKKLKSDEFDPVKNAVAAIKGSFHSAENKESESIMDQEFAEDFDDRSTRIVDELDVGDMGEVSDMEPVPSPSGTSSHLFLILAIAVCVLAVWFANGGTLDQLGVLPVTIPGIKNIQSCHIMGLLPAGKTGQGFDAVDDFGLPASRAFEAVSGARDAIQGACTDFRLPKTLGKDSDGASAPLRLGASLGEDYSGL